MRLSVKSVGDGADYRVRHFRLSRRTKMSEIEKKRIQNGTGSN